MSYSACTRPTMFFIGVTTGKSSINRVFPRWAEALGLGDCELRGMDFPLHADPASYRAAVDFIKADPLAFGALVFALGRVRVAGWDRRSASALLHLPLRYVRPAAASARGAGRLSPAARKMTGATTRRLLPHRRSNPDNRRYGFGQRVF